MFKPLTPVINDLFSHTFNEAKHLSTIHMTYGKNHKDIELASTEDDTRTGKNQSIINSVDTIPYHIIFDERYKSFAAEHTTINYATLNVRRLLTIFISKRIPPPRL